MRNIKLFAAQANVPRRMPTKEAWILMFYSREGLGIMIRSGVVSLLLGALMWSQSAATPQGLPAQTIGANGSIETKPTEFPNIGPDAVVMTIDGLCDNPGEDKATTSGCKVVFTRAQFEAFADLVQPSLPPERRRQLAGSYADMLILAQQARQMNLDKSARFEELVKMQRLNVLAQLLKQALQEKASHISDKDIIDYYRKNMSEYEEARLQRIYVPIAQQLDPPKGKLTAADTQKRQEDSKAAMKKEAAELDARAIAGEDFAKLQEEAYKVAEVKTAFPPSIMQTYHRRDLSAAQVSAMNLKPGEISPVIEDANGYFIYKAGEKNMVPLEEVRNQITSMLRSQRFQEYMKAAQTSATTVLNDEYFRAITPAERQGVSVPTGPRAAGKGPGPAE